MSNTEYLLNALKTGEDVSGFIPQSRQEEILKRICLKEPLDDLTPLSRVERLLIEAAENISGGGDISVNDDGNGNVVLGDDATTVSDDGEGNVVIS